MDQKEWFISAQIYTPVANTKTKPDYANICKAPGYLEGGNLDH